MRKNRKLSVRFKQGDREQIENLLRSGVASVRVVKRALSLRLLEQGQSPPRVGDAVGLSAEAVRRMGWRYAGAGLAGALYEKPRPGAKPLMTTGQKQQVIAMVCGPAPDGQARWTVRLITEEAIKRKLVDPVGRETIRLLLQQHDLKPWREKNVVRG
jgi:putative transposase